MWNKEYRHTFFVWAIICLPLLCLSCKTKQKVANTTPIPSEIIQSISTKSTFSLHQGWKELFTSSATLRIKRDSLILLSIQPIAGVEVARISLDQQYITLIDRIHKQYVRSSYEELNNRLKQSGNSSMKPDCFLHTIQSILCGELFLCENTKPAQMSDFTAMEIDRTQFLQRSHQSLMQEFTTDSTFQATSGSLFDENMRLKWEYFATRLASLGNIPLSTRLHIETSPQNKIHLELVHKKIETNSDFNLSNNIPKGYKEVTFEELIASLEKNS